MSSMYKVTPLKPRPLTVYRTALLERAEVIAEALQQHYPITASTSQRWNGPTCDYIETVVTVTENRTSLNERELSKWCDGYSCAKFGE